MADQRNPVSCQEMVEIVNREAARDPHIDETFMALADAVLRASRDNWGPKVRECAEHGHDEVTLYIAVRNEAFQAAVFALPLNHDMPSGFIVSPE